MQFSSEWQLRVDRWLDALQQRVMTSLAELPTEMAQTAQQYRPEELSALKFRPVRIGQAWGKSFEYAWFRSAAKLPAGIKIAHPVLTAQAGKESVVFVDGLAAGALNPWHRHVDLPALKRGGQAAVLIEAYSGNPNQVSGMFVPPGKSAVSAPATNHLSFGGLFVCDFNDEAFALWMDGMTLRRLAKSCPQDSLRRHKIEQALVAASLAVDVEAPCDQFDRQLPQARAILAPLLACRNGPSVPMMHCFGHAHIDLAWLWPMRQSYRKAGATFATALALMKHYPDYRFLQSQAQIYEWVRRDYPEVFAGIKRAVARGQWIADGGMWVESDTNVTGGEALIRQFMYGRRYFKDTFGVNSRTCWLPDVFGYSAALPQIMKGCGIDYFSTQKIYWNYHGGTTFPYETFTWEGLGGRSVLAHLHRDYNAFTDPAAITARWQQCVQKDANDSFLYPFGYGDGGGGPTIEHLEYLARENNLEGMPATRQGSLDEFFAALEKKGQPEARYVGELYFEAHRGTYTSQAWIKRLNRKCEFAMREAELWSALSWMAERGEKAWRQTAAAMAPESKQYPAAELEAQWKNVLLNQFHDILPGSSIQVVYQEAEELAQDVLAGADAIAAAARGVQPQQGAFTVFNSLSWRRNEVVALPAGSARGVTDGVGNPLPVQAVGSGANRRLLVAVDDIPSMGCKVLRLDEKSTPAAAVPSVTARATSAGVVVENEFYQLTIDRMGRVSRLLDKSTGRELVGPDRPANQVQVFRDNPTDFDAWDIDPSYQFSPVALPARATVRLMWAGPLEARVRVERPLSKTSSLEQEIVVRAGSRRIDFETQVDWQEQHRLLKVAFPAQLSAGVLRGEVQFGHVIRPTHRNTDFERARFEWPAQKWASLAEPEIGLAILNDCKYGHDFLDGHLRLTLLRAPVAPDPQADRRRHEFVYSMLVHGPFAYGEAIRAAYQLNVPVTVASGLAEFAQDGQGLLEVSNPNVIIETVKRSEEGGGLIVRLYEAIGASAQAELTCRLPFVSAHLCNMVEESAGRLAVSGGKVKLRLRPFEVQTILLTTGGRTKD